MASDVGDAGDAGDVGASAAAAGGWLICGELGPAVRSKRAAHILAVLLIYGCDQPRPEINLTGELDRF